MTSEALFLFQEAELVSELFTWIIGLSIARTKREKVKHTVIMKLSNLFETNLKISWQMITKSNYFFPHL